MKRRLLYLSTLIFTFTFFNQLKAQKAPQYSNSELNQKSYSELSEEFKYLFDNSLVPEEKQHRKYLRRSMFEHLLTVIPGETNQNFGKTLEEARTQTVKKLQSQKAARKNAAIPNVKWTERGPNNVGGRSRGLAYDINDTTYRKVWTGGIAGGLFYNNNIADVNSSWQAVNLPEIISVTAIAFDPVNKQTMYVGTGEHSGGPNIPGGNVWKSTDNGKNWTKLPQVLSAWTKEIVVTKMGTIIVATLSGLQRSTDGGNTFRVMVSGGTNGGNSDVEIASDGVIYAGFERGKVFKSDDDGLTWTNISPTESINARVEIALAPSTQGENQVIYAISGDIWFKKSVDAGKTWENLQVPLYDDGTKYGSSQVTYNMTMSVHPKDPNFVWLGGTGIFHTLDGGKNWKQYGYWYIHPDQHNIQFSPLNNGEMILANDGGIHFAKQAGNPKNVVADFKARNKDYTVTQFYSVALRNIIGDNFIIGGAQDNSVISINGEGKTDGKSVITGDGCFVFVDEDEPNVMVTSTQNGNWYVKNRNGQAIYGFSSGTSPAFVNPADYDDINNILYANNGSRSIARVSRIGLSASPIVKQVVFKPALPTFVNAIKVAKNAPNTIFVGTGSNGRIYKVTDMDKDTATVTLISSPEMTTLGLTASNIDIGTTDDELMVTYSNFSTSPTLNVLSVWYTNDGGLTWKSKDEREHGLPNVQIRWSLFNPENTKQVITATRLGVYSTNDITADNPAWELSSEGLALTDCRMLSYRPADGMVAVATAGRGFYTTDIFAKKVEKGSINLSQLPVVTACADSTFDVSFTTTGSFGNSNRYQVILSGEDGTFKNEFLIGSGTSSPVRVTIPRTLLATFVKETANVGGNFVGEAKYKIKIVSTQPAFESDNTGEFNLKAIQTSFYSGYTSICTPTGRTTIAAVKGKDAKIEWFRVANNVATPVASTTDSSILVGTGTYYFRVTQNGCKSQSANRTVGSSSGSPFLQASPVFVSDNIANACIGSGIIVKSPSADTVNFNYRWRKDNVFVENTNRPTYKATENGSFDVSLDHKTTGCSFVYRPLAIKLKDRAEVSLTANGPTEIKYGNSANIDLKFNSNTPRPFDVILSDNQKFTINDTLASATIFPKKSGLFTVSSISNICGAGTVKNGVDITVNPLILNSLLSTPKTFYCANEEITLGYTIDGVPEKDNVYTVQLSDEKGDNFKNLTTLGNDKTLKVILPKDIKAGNKYRLRVVASNPAITGTVTKDSLNIKALATGTVTSKDTSIYRNASVIVSYAFTGDAPWSIQTIDNQKVDVPQSPYNVTVTPKETTTYTLISVKDNSCGEGFVSGSMRITVLEPLSAEEDANSIFSVFPNPTESNVTVSLKIPSNKSTNVEVRNTQGNIVAKSSIKSGQTSETINLENLSTGVYLIQVQQDEKQSVKKIVKIK